MGTRYQKGDIVKFERKNAEVLEVIQPESDSPIYRIEVKNHYNKEEDGKTELAKASDLKKVDQDFSEGDTVKRFEGYLNGMAEVVMYDVVAVRENALIVKLWGEDSEPITARKIDFRK